MDTLAARLRKARDQAGLTQRELEQMSGVKQQMISKLETGQSEETSKLVNLATACGVRPLWLATGEGPITESQTAENAGLYASVPVLCHGGQSGALPPLVSFRPIIEWERPEDLPEGQYVFVRHSQVRFSAGNGGLVFEEADLDPLAFTTRWVKSRGLRHSDLVAVSANGDSMEPTIGDGDKILINRAETTLREGQIFAIRYGDELRIKRLYARYDGGVILRSDNREKYPDEPVPASERSHIEIIGRVIWAAGEM